MKHGPGLHVLEQTKSHFRAGEQEWRQHPLVHSQDLPATASVHARQQRAENLVATQTGQECQCSNMCQVKPEERDI